MKRLWFNKRVRVSRTLFLTTISVLTVVSLAGAVGSIASRIEKARVPILKSDRAASMKLFKDLLREIQSEIPAKVSKSSFQEVSDAWRETAEVFLTDKGQNQFSLAESLWMAKPKEAVDTLLPLLKVEDGNLSVARLGTRAALRMFDCAKAETFLQQAEQTFPFGLDVKLLKLQVQDCVNGTSATAPAMAALASWPADSSEAGEYDSAIRVLQARDSERRKDLKAAHAAMAAWEQRPSVRSADDPEFWYWKWRLSPVASRDRTAGRKYLRLCTEMTPRRRKNFAIHPELCLHTETVESDLKSSDKSGV